MFKLNIKRLLIILISISVISFSIAGVILLTTGGLKKNNVISFKDKRSNSYDIKDEKVEKINDIKEIYIENSSEDISLIPEKRQDIKCSFYGNIESSFKPKLETKIEGNKLIISTNNHPSNFSVFSNSLKLNINIPENYAADIKIKSTSGNFNLSSPLKLNLFDLTSSSGDINVKNLTSSTFNIHCTSGNIKGENIICTNSNMKSSSGDTILKDFKGNLQHQSTSGRIDLGFKDFNNNINLQTTSGDILLSLPKASQFAVNAKATSGDVESDFPITMQGKSKNNQLNGVVGTNKNQVNISATSGNIKIKAN